MQPRELCMYEYKMKWKHLNMPCSIHHGGRVHRVPHCTNSWHLDQTWCLPIRHSVILALIAALIDELNKQKQDNRHAVERKWSRIHMLISALQAIARQMMSVFMVSGHHQCSDSFSALWQWFCKNNNLPKSSTSLGPNSRSGISHQWLRSGHCEGHSI